MNTAYAVRIETWSTSMFSILAGLEPIVTYRYYRWRWVAKLCAFLDSGVRMGTATRATLLGRVRLKSKARMVAEESHKLQRGIYKNCCAEIHARRAAKDASERSAAIYEAWRERLTQTSVN